MKFKILIALLLLGHHHSPLTPPHYLSSKSTAKKGQPSHPTELARSMLLQRIIAKHENLDLEGLSTQVQSMVLANDFRPSPGFTAEKKNSLRRLTQNALNSSTNPDVSNTAVPIDDALIRNLEITQAQKRLLLLQFYEVIKETQSQENISDPSIVKLLTSYLQHLSYIYEKENRANEAVPPVIYNYHINQVIAPYCDSPSLELPPEEFLNERDDPLIDAFDGYNMDNMHAVRTTLKLVSRKARKAKGMNRKLFFGLFNRPPGQQSKTGVGAADVPEKPKDTEIYTKSVYDLAIEDHVDEVNKKWVIDYEGLDNLREMVIALAEQYKTLFEPITKLNDKLRQAVYAEDARLAIENFDEVKGIAQQVISTDNRHKEVMNQIIANFNNRNPDLDYFLAIHKHPPMLANLARLRAAAASDKAATSGKTLEDTKFQAILDQLRESYFTIIKGAKTCDSVYDNFAYQTQIIRTSADSSTYNRRTQMAVLANLRKLIPLLARFSSTFISNLEQLGRDLKTLEENETQLFDAAVELEHKIDMADYRIKENNRRPWWQRFIPRKAKAQDKTKIKG